MKYYIKVKPHIAASAHLVSLCFSHDLKILNIYELKTIFICIVLSANAIDERLFHYLS